MIANKILIANHGLVIASEAKQSSVPEHLDCRVAALLAMTELVVRKFGEVRV